MATLKTMLMQASHLDDDDRDWIRRLLGDWQLIADAAFADLLLSVRADDGSPLIVRHCRPATSGTAYEDDIVGGAYVDILEDTASLCFEDGRVRRVKHYGNEHTFYPFKYGGKIIGLLDVVVPASNLESPWVSPTGGPNEYAVIAETLLAMVTTSEFPQEKIRSDFHISPRLTDGFVHLDDKGVVVYASPNAISNFHRLGVPGGLIGESLPKLLVDAANSDWEYDASLPGSFNDRFPWVSTVETSSVSIAFRSVPLLENNHYLGALILCRDVTEIRRHEKELMTKDATIREINHRVKNNLQTVSALLRMQARRAENEDTQSALFEAQQRVAAIALVHQILSQSIDERADFDEVISPLLEMASELASTDGKVSVECEGRFGEIGATQTTALAVVMNELISNAVEHGLPHGGLIRVVSERVGNQLTISLIDNGVGIGEDGPGNGLGTSIVRSFVQGELHGSIEWQRHEGGGTCVRLDIRIDDSQGESDEL